MSLIWLLGILDASYYAPELSVTVGWLTLCTLPVLALIWPFLSGGVGGFLTILIGRRDNPAIEIADALVVARNWAIGLLVGCVVGLPIPGCIHTILASRPLNTSKDIGAFNLLILSGFAIALGLGIAGAVTGSLRGRLMFQRLANVGQDPGQLGASNAD